MGKIAIVVVLAAGAFLGIFGLSGRVEPPTPPLLIGASAGGGWLSGGCPPEFSFEKPYHEAISPEIEARLKRQFPRGTPAYSLRNSLLTQGFKQIENCSEDASIKRATFRQTGGAFFGPYPASSLIAWKEDDHGKIVWVKGFVKYTGP